MPSPSISRRQNFQNGTVLAINQAARVVNFPLAQEVARHVRKLVVVLKAPKDNDMSAQELADRIGELLDFLDEAADETGSNPNISENAAGYLLELEQLRSNLHRSLSELQTMRNVDYTTKLASQAQICDSIQHKEAQLTKARFDVLTCLTMFTVSNGFALSKRDLDRHNTDPERLQFLQLAKGLQNTHALLHTLQTFQTVEDTCEALRQRQERLERRNSVVSSKWQVDEHGSPSIAYTMLGNRPSSR